MDVDPLVGFSFRDRKSIQRQVDLLVVMQPAIFPDRATVLRKGLHLLLRTLEKQQQLPAERSEGG